MKSMTNFPNVNYTLENNLCTGCGICSGACPADAITTVVTGGRFLPSIDHNKCRNSKGCHRCFDACPGVGVNLIKLSKELFTDKSTLEDKMCGRYLKCYTGYSNDYDIRFHSASGGMVSQFLIWLLENNKIDGALVSKFDKSNPLKVKSFIARNKEDVLAAKSSKYAPVSLHEAIKVLKAVPEGKYVVVGLPCHIHGFRKIESIDKKLASKVFGHFAIYCSASRTFNFTEYIMKEREINIENIDYLAYRDRGNQGGLVVQGKSIDYYQDYRKYCHPLKSIFNPRRCLLCIDHYGELSDISFGDINIAPYNEDKVGINSLIVRNISWHTLIKEACEAGCIHLEEIKANTINDSQPSAKMKKGRNMRFVYMLQKMGCEVPQYDTNANLFKKSDIIKYIANRMQQFIGSHKVLWPIINIIKK